MPGLTTVGRLSRLGSIHLQSPTRTVARNGHLGRVGSCRIVGHSEKEAAATYDAARPTSSGRSVDADELVFHVARLRYSRVDSLCLSRKIWVDCAHYNSRMNGDPLPVEPQEMPAVVR